MDVSVFGTGYVGPIKTEALTDVGHRVLCADIDPDKIKQRQKALPTISEPGLSGTVAENKKADRTLYSPQQVVAAGLHYSCIGLRPIAPEAPRP
ncbi:UDP-glucose 6-dehydrogenase [Pseudomonas sp. JAI111]|nr:UDP-glucose 6-dehydrogenase [Pseudomonas sp. JAI111]